MFKSILAAVDTSPHGDGVCSQAIHIAQETGGRVLLLHVIDRRKLEGAYLGDLVGFMGLGPFLDIQNQVRSQLEKQGQVILDVMLARCAEAGVAAETAIVHGFVPEEIAQASKQADLVVLGRKGEHHGLNRALLGSTFESTVRLLRVPCLVAGDKVSSLKTLLLAYDGSQLASSALKLAAGLAEQGRQLCVVIAEDGEGEKHAQEARNYLRSHGVTAGFELRPGAASPAIVQAARDVGADAIIMGAFSHSVVREVFLGSTTADVIEQSPVPLLLCR